MTKRIYHYKESEARDFFERLKVYSEEYVKYAIPKLYPSWPSVNNYEEWKNEIPKGNILHYTAGVSFSGTIRHFVLNHTSSSNWVVSKEIDKRFINLKSKLKLDNDLRSEIVQVIDPYYPSWHAGWVNRILTGIEARNVGILRPIKKGKQIHPIILEMKDFFVDKDDSDIDDYDYFWWSNQWTSKFKGEVLRIETKRGVCFWESWSRSMVSSIIILLRYLNSLFRENLDPVWMLAHHNVNRYKNDIVYPIDLHGIRDAVLFSNEHVDDIEWLAELDDYEGGFEDEDDPWMLRTLSEKQNDRYEEDFNNYDDKIVGKIDNNEEVKRALYLLGYYVNTNEDFNKSLSIYKYSRNIDTKYICNRTKVSLERELKKWGLK